jgi:hypothetical protein
VSADIIRTHPDKAEVDAYDEISIDRGSGGEEQSHSTLLTKSYAEKLFCINLFVAMKQERFAGRNMEEGVRHILSAELSV